MVLKTTPKQARQIHRLVRRQCANCVDGNCLLLDNGEPHRCVQLLCLYGIYCNYFLRAVLPGDKKLYNEIKTQNQNGKEN